MSFVLDASATLPWCFKDETTPWTEALLDDINSGQRVFVPSHWPVEVSNSLLMAVRRKRIERSLASSFWDDLAKLPISVELALTPAQAKSILTLAEQYRLTFYDATYLELAQRMDLPLATLDGQLIDAAKTCGARLVR